MLHLGAYNGDSATGPLQALQKNRHCKACNRNSPMKTFHHLCKKKKGMEDTDLIKNTIYWIRGEQVMLDSDLAQLYGVETKQLKRQVRRNAIRFPDDFMFQLSGDEVASLRCQNGTTNRVDQPIDRRAKDGEGSNG
jgi:hypothetical protein